MLKEGLPYRSLSVGTCLRRSSTCFESGARSTTSNLRHSVGGAGCVYPMQAMRTPSRYRHSARSLLYFRELHCPHAGKTLPMRSGPKSAPE